MFITVGDPAKSLRDYCMMDGKYSGTVQISSPSHTKIIQTISHVKILPQLPIVVQLRRYVSIWNFLGPGPIL